MEVTGLYLDEIRRILLEERDSGTLTQIPVDIYQETNITIKELQEEVYAQDDPFSGEAGRIIEEVSSIRVTIDEIFRIRSEKIISLAQNQSDGQFINREELRSLIPAEMTLLNSVVDAIRVSRESLIEWKTSKITPVSPPPPVYEPREVYDTNNSDSEYEQEHQGDDEISHAISDEISDSGVHGIDAGAFGEKSARAAIERAGPPNEFEEELISDNNSVFPYSLVRVLSGMEPFMGVDSNTYEIAAGDIITLPTRNAEVLIERNIVLNINQG